MSSYQPLPSFPYRFVPQISDPTDRRLYLDTAGRYTQAASDAFVVIVFIYFNLVVQKRDVKKKDGTRKGQGTTPTDTKLQRVNMIALTGQKETKASVVLVSIWASMIAVLVLWRTGDDYLHITRSPAQVASALLGANVVFSLPFIRDYTPSLISFHRLQSVLMFTLLALHAVLYLNFYVQNDLLAKRVKDLDVQLGIILFLLSSGLWITGAKMNKFKMKFGVVQARQAHVALTVAFGIALWFHVVHSHSNLRRAGLVWALGQAWRLWSGTEVRRVASRTGKNQ